MKAAGCRVSFTRVALKSLGALMLLAGAQFLGSDATRSAYATPGGTVIIPTKGVAWNAADVTLNLNIQDLGTLTNCFADPSLAASGSGTAVTYASSTATDSGKNFATNALSGKPIYASSGTVISGPSPSYAMTTVTDMTQNFTANALAGLTVSAANIFGSGGGVTYTTTTLADTAKAFVPEQLVGRTVTAGTGTGVVAHNTATTVTLANVGGSGASVTYTPTSVTDTSQAFVTNQLAGRTVTSGAHSGTVTSNSTTTINLSASWTGGTPTAGSAYSLNTGWTGSTPINGSFYVISTSTDSGVIVSNTANTISIAGVWSPTTPPDGTSFSIAVPAGKITGTGGGVTYTRSDSGAGGVTYTSTSLTDALKAWTPNEFVGANVAAGASTGVVASNTATTLTLSAAWSGGTPPASTPYVINASVKDTALNLSTNVLAGMPVVAIVPAISGAGGTVSYTSVTGSGGTVTYGTSTFTDTAASFPNLVGKTVYAGGSTGVVQSNNSTLVTITAPWTGGTPASGTTYVIATMTDTSKSFPVNSLVGRSILSGSNSAVILSNTATAVTLQTPWSPATPAPGAAYTITAQPDTGTIQSNTNNRLSLNGGWSPFTPTAGSVYYVGVTDLTGTVASNTATVMTLTSPWSPVAPSAGTPYSVVNSQPTSACGLGSYQTTITFDPSKLQYLSATNGPFLTSTGRTLFVSPCTPTATSNTVSFNCTTNGNTPLGAIGSGSLAVLHFKPLVSGSAGTTTLTHTTSLADIQGNAISHTDTAGTITFKRCADVSGNGIVTLADASMVLVHVGQTYINDPNWSTDNLYDLNRNNAVTLGDVAYAIEQVPQQCAFVP